MNPGKLRRWAVCAVVGALVALTACGNGGGDGGDGGDNGDAKPNHELSLAVYRGESRQGEQLGTATLTCEPAGGDHANAKRACEQLTTTDGDFTKLPRTEQACTMIYQPVTAVATGNWGNTQISFEKTYGNSCELDAATGAVFAFPVKD